MGSKNEVVKIWLSADAVCFDVDSTLCQEEAIDELAKFSGVGKEVEQWTKVAMGGAVSFRDALTARLNIIKPSQSTIKQFLQQNPPRLTDGVQELIESLHRKDVDVYLVSGGFRCIIEMVAGKLNISKDHIFANRLYFDFNGNYAGFNEKEPTSNSGGKTEVIRQLKEKHQYKHLIMIGDGATDMEACPPADAFIGFGGNIEREKVKKESKWFVTSFKELCNS